MNEILTDQEKLISFLARPFSCSAVKCKNFVSMILSYFPQNFEP